jgi:hypothetical protein
MEDPIINTTNIVNDTTESSQPTIEQHQQTKDTPKELIEETATVLQKLKEATKEATETSSPTLSERKELDEKIKNVKNPFKNLTPRATQLVYWENPTHSGALLAIGLTSLIFTANYSMFNTFCALATILIGVNWIYVMGRKQLQSLINQKPVNPHEHLLVKKPWYIERQEAEKYLDVTVDAVNFVLLEAQRIVLVDDPMQTIKYVFLFYVLWTLGTWISPRTLIGIGMA